MFWLQRKIKCEIEKYAVDGHPELCLPLGNATDRLTQIQQENVALIKHLRTPTASRVYVHWDVPLRLVDESEFTTADIICASALRESRISRSVGELAGGTTFNDHVLRNQADPFEESSYPQLRTTIEGVVQHTRLLPPQFFNGGCRCGKLGHTFFWQGRLLSCTDGSTVAPTVDSTLTLDEIIETPAPAPLPDAGSHEKKGDTDDDDKTPTSLTSMY